MTLTSALHSYHRDMKSKSFDNSKVSTSGWREQCFSKQMILPISCGVLSSFLYTKSALTVKDFVYDEKVVILKNPDVIGLTPIWTVFQHDYSGFPRDVDGYVERPHNRSFRPIGTLSLRLSHAVYGMSSKGFRLENMLLYSILCFQFAILSQKLSSEVPFSANTVEKDYRYIFKTSSCWLSSFFFLAHPIHTEIVCSTVGRSDLLGALFFIASFRLLIDASKNTMFCRYEGRQHLYAVILTFFAHYSNGTGIGMFLFFACYDLINISIGNTSTNAFSKRKKSKQKVIRRLHLSQDPCVSSYSSSKKRHMLTLYTGTFRDKIKSPILRRIACNSFCSVAFSIMPGNSLSSHNDIVQVSGLNWMQHILTFIYSFSLQASKLCNPVSNLSFDYSWPCSTPILSLFDARNVVSLFVAYLLWRLLRIGFKYCHRVIFVYVALITIIMTISISEGNKNDKTLLLPSIGICLLYGICFRHTAHMIICDLKLLPKGRQWRQRFRIFLITCVSATCFIVMVTESKSRSMEWGDEYLLFQSALQVCPVNIVALTAFATHLNNNHEHLGSLGAIDLLERVNKIVPNYPEALFRRGLIHYYNLEYESAETAFKDVITRYPNFGRALLFMGSLKLQLGNERSNEMVARSTWKESLDFIEKSLTFIDTPLAHAIRCELGLNLSLPANDTLKHCDLALELNRKAVSMNHGKDVIVEEITYNNAALILKEEKRYSESMNTLREGLKHYPNDVDMLVNLGSILIINGSYKEALEYCNKALQLKPDDQKILVNCGWLLGMSKSNLTEAESYYEHALKQPNPRSQVIENLQSIHAKRKGIDTADQITS